MRRTYVDTAAAIGRGLRAALSLGCLSNESARTRTLSPTTLHPAADVAAIPATTGFAFAVTGANAMKRTGTHPPQELAALL
ncbi:MAG TPA: hypothetical protein VNB94_00460 [Mycobacteriales bacterium]|nr:hypothetical protein [Mycobacteriales bacterium]